MQKTFAFIFILASLHCNGQTLNEWYQRGNEAFLRGDYYDYRRSMEVIDSIRPNYAPVVYKLAQAQNLLGDQDLAMGTLRRLINMDIDFDFENDSIFHNLKYHPQYIELRNIRQMLSTQVNNARIFKSLNIQSKHPESIAFNENNEKFLIGAVRTGEILIENDLLIKPQNSWSVMGMDLTSDLKTLWVCTSAMDQYEEIKEDDLNKANLLKIDLDSRKVVKIYSIDGLHNFGDLIIDSKDRVYISDGTANAIFSVDENDNLYRFFDGSDQFLNMQGIAFDTKEQNIFISDYIKGLYRLEIRTGKLHKIHTKCDCTTNGIDGLYYFKNQLIALHNGTNPKRAMIYELDGDNIVDSKTIAQGGEDLNEPTQGVIVDDDFYFIGNSPWTSYNEDGSFEMSETDSKIFTFSLE